MKELQRRTIGLAISCYTLLILIIILSYTFTKQITKQEHRLNEQKRLLIALTHKVNENNIYKNTSTK